MTKSKARQTGNLNGVTQITSSKGVSQKAKGKGDNNIVAGKQTPVNGRDKQRPSPSVKSGNEVHRKKNGVHSNGSEIYISQVDLQLKKMRDADRQEREGLVLWKRPITTLQYFVIELCLNMQEYALQLWKHKLSVFVFFAMILASVVAYHIPGPHQTFVVSMEKQVLWCLYWLGLGVLSSVGLGTGLHTFLLYLGPHIAAVTLAAYECETLDFPSPPYPDSIICPEDEGGVRLPITLWSIMSKVRLEAMMWGAGTALGELPPYFMARAARLSTLGTGGKRGRRRSSIEYSDDVEKLAEFEALKLKQQHPEDMTLMDRLKLAVERLVERVGFFGILACASIPNPLFDLAGITCGHFLVPFWTFFGATLIGKAVIKTHIQQLTVIVAFNENLVSKLVVGLAKIPVIGVRLQEPLEQLLRSQKAKLHSREGQVPADGGSLLASLFEKLVLIMVVYFVLSIINSLAQNYHQRMSCKKQKLMEATPRLAKNNSKKA